MVVALRLLPAVCVGLLPDGAVKQMHLPACTGRWGTSVISLRRSWTSFGNGVPALRYTHLAGHLYPACFCPSMAAWPAGKRLCALSFLCGSNGQGSRRDMYILPSSCSRWRDGLRPTATRLLHLPLRYAFCGAGTCALLALRGRKYFSGDCVYLYSWRYRFVLRRRQRDGSDGGLPAASFFPYYCDNQRSLRCGAVPGRRSSGRHCTRASREEGIFYALSPWVSGIAAGHRTPLVLCLNSLLLLLSLRSSLEQPLRLAARNVPSAACASGRLLSVVRSIGGDVYRGLTRLYADG